MDSSVFTSVSLGLEWLYEEHSNLLEKGSSVDTEYLRGIYLIRNRKNVSANGVLAILSLERQANKWS